MNGALHSLRSFMLVKGVLSGRTVEAIQVLVSLVNIGLVASF